MTTKPSLRLQHANKYTIYLFKIHPPASIQAASNFSSFYKVLIVPNKTKAPGLSAILCSVFQIAKLNNPDVTMIKLDFARVAMTTTLNIIILLDAISLHTILFGAGLGIIRLTRL